MPKTTIYQEYTWIFTIFMLCVIYVYCHLLVYNLHCYRQHAHLRKAGRFDMVFDT